MVVPSKTYVCGLLIAEIAGSNSSEDMDVHPFWFLFCVGSGLLFQRSPARCKLVSVRNMEISIMRRPMPDLACTFIEKVTHLLFLHYGTAEGCI